MPFSNPFSNVKLPKCLLIPLAAFAFQSVEAAGESNVSLAWDAVLESNVTGYRVHVGTQSGVYTQTREAGLEVSHVVTNLDFGQTYYFAVTAVNDTAESSDFSTELVVTLAPPQPTAGNTLSITNPGEADLTWQYSRADIGSTTEFIIYGSDDLVVWREVGLVLPHQPSSSDEETLTYTWSMETTAPKMFFKVTARSPEGES